MIHGVLSFDRLDICHSFDNPRFRRIWGKSYLILEFILRHTSLSPSILLWVDLDMESANAKIIIPYYLLIHYNASTFTQVDPSQFHLKSPQPSLSRSSDPFCTSEHTHILCWDLQPPNIHRKNRHLSSAFMHNSNLQGV